MKKERPDLLALAEAAQKKSYSPYSARKVGAAVRFEDGSVQTGCNIENSSYGGTVCAERVAIWKGVSEGSKVVVEIAVFTDADPPWPPCGLCRQVIAEFAEDDAVVHRSNGRSPVITVRFKDIYPDAFRPKHLLKP